MKEGIETKVAKLDIKTALFLIRKVSNDYFSSKRLSKPFESHRDAGAREFISHLNERLLEIKEEGLELTPKTPIHQSHEEDI